MMELAKTAQAEHLEHGECHVSPVGQCREQQVVRIMGPVIDGELNVDHVAVIRLKALASLHGFVLQDFHMRAE